jgi:hypothetical protein
MRVLPLKTAQVHPIGAPAPMPLPYSDLYRSVLTLNRNGVQITEMRQAIRILDVIEGAAIDAEGTGKFYLEDVDWTYLKTRVETFQWATIDRVIVNFVDGVLLAEVYDPNAPAAAPVEPPADTPQTE